MKAATLGKTFGGDLEFRKINGIGCVITGTLNYNYGREYGLAPHNVHYYCICTGVT